uniref:NADH-ubiquinone oxidoreductase chain 4 n=1 Tax=Psococerastis albimaculata TaxID=1264641 RepID=M9P7B6_9NEOP|nr:NADH dehydrogenase subunit 4 [Psococerastis albimaculata]AFY16892.1 NADH dehydrogenase subunit 4 [Psococerastis albimaculata]
MLKYGLMILFMTPLFGLGWGLTQFLLGLISFMFMLELSDFHFLEKLNNIMGLDLMSYMLIMLSMWICMLMLVGSESVKSTKFFPDKFILVLVFMVIFLFMSFSMMNYFMFYLFFESSLIPTFMLILGWGYQSERIQAGVYMLLYTLFASLPLLLILFYLYKHMFSFSFYFLMYSKLYMNMFLLTGLYLGFLVKLPMFLVHLWLPKAHVEAPVAGSMILAGVLLKLGGYGILRFSILLKNILIKFSMIFILLSMIGGVLIGLNCLRQSDMKLLVAYSSVGHMGIMLGGVMTMNYWGMNMSLLMMLSHGLCSSGLFFLINCCYERVSSRSLLLVRGMTHLLPKMSLWWFLFCVMNMAAPPSLNLLSEIGLINSLISWSKLNFLCLMMMGFFAAGYSLYLFSYSQHGKISFSIYSFYGNNVREFMILFLHWIPLNFLILNSDIIVLWL